MAVCFDGHGTIRLKKETAKDFADKFNELLGKYDSDANFMCNDEGLLQFKNYARHFFMRDCRQLIEDNIDLVEDGRVWFNCHDEDGSVNSPFPFAVLLEVVDGEVYEETLNTRLPYDWSWYNVDDEWFDKCNKR